MCIRDRPQPQPLVQLGGALAGHAALLPPFAAARARLLVRFDDGPPIPVEVPPRGDWQPFSIDTLHLAPAPHAVTLEAEVPAGATLCVEALVLP